MFRSFQYTLIAFFNFVTSSQVVLQRERCNIFTTPQTEKVISTLNI